MNAYQTKTLGGGCSWTFGQDCKFPLRSNQSLATDLFHVVLSRLLHAAADLHLPDVQGARLDLVNALLQRVSQF